MNDSTETYGLPMIMKLILINSVKHARKSNLQLIVFIIGIISMTQREIYQTIINNHQSSSSLWTNCRPDIQRRINALLNYQVEYFRLRVEFYRQIQDLQYRYSPQFEQITQRRRKIIQGLSESTTDHVPAKGVPNFWLTVLKNFNSYDYPIQPRDELCLEYLIDIRCILNPSNTQMTSFLLEFHFLPTNPFFTETILTKYYSIRLELDESNPYRSYDGPEIDRCHGCSITWKPEHNLMIEKRTKRLRNKNSGEIRYVQVEEPIKCFFDFFSSVLIPDGGINEMSDEDQIRLEADIEFGLLLKQRILPKAILYYTGEALSEYNEDDSSDGSRERL